MLDLASITVLDLQRVHPEWVAHRDMWDELDAIRSHRIHSERSRWLPKGHLEAEGEYAFRLELTRFVPEAPTARNRVIGAVFQEIPSRDELPDALKEWATRVDRSGLDFSAWLETKVAPVAFDFRYAWVLVDRGAPDERTDDPRFTKEDETEADTQRPFLVAYDPRQVRNWRFTKHGDLDFALILEEEWAQDEALGKRAPRRVYRLFDRDHWHVVTTEPADGEDHFKDPDWEDSGEPKDKPGSVVAGASENILSRDAGPHGSPGTIPLLRFDVCSSIIANAAQLDFKRLALESDQTYALFTHGHPQLSVFTNDDLETVGLGVGKFLKFKAKTKDETEGAEYVTPGAESFQAREREIQAVKVDTYRHTGADPQGVIVGREGTPQAVSGVSRIVSYRTSEGRHVGRLRDRIEEGENAIWRVVGKFLGAEPEDGNPVNWPNTIDDQTTSDALDDFTALKGATRSDTLVRVKEKQLARKLVGDETKKTLATIDAEIDAAPMRQVVPAFGALDQTEEEE